jgi:hypothetical protein
MNLAAPAPTPTPPAGGGISSVVGGVSPSWGPFGSLGAQATTVIDVVMAAVLVICVVIALFGASKQRFGGASRNSMHAEEGKSLLISGLAGAFIVSSLMTLFTVTYGMGI